MDYNEGIGSKIFDITLIIFMIILIIVTIYPLVYVISISLSSTKYVQANLVSIFPKGFNLDSYKRIFGNKLFWGAYKNTIVYTVVGTVINIIFTCAMAFVLSRKDFIFKSQLTIMVLITMFFSGGLIPSFILIKNLHMYNTMWAVILPGAISTWNMIIVKTYMQGLPEEIMESSRIDGANDLVIFFKIVIPLSMPVIATIGLFYAVGHWNDYFAPMIFFKEKAKLPLQVILRNMIVDTDLQGMQDQAKNAATQQAPNSDMVIATAMVVAMIPILCIYPFLQKYFVKGIMVGSLKG